MPADGLGITKRIDSELFFTGFLIPWNQRSINAKWYNTKCLSEVFSVLNNKRPKTWFRGLRLQHDNAPTHEYRPQKELSVSFIFLKDDKARLPDWWLLNDMLRWLQIRYKCRIVMMVRETGFSLRIMKACYDSRDVIQVIRDIKRTDCVLYL